MSVYKNTPEIISCRAALIKALLKKDDALALHDPALTKWAVERGLGAMLYYLYHDKLPETDHALCGRQYRFAAAQDLRYSAAYSGIQKIFASEKVDYIPLKGMALIRQGIYGSGALRLHCDMDLLLRNKSECLRVFDILRKNGWKVSGQPEQNYRRKTTLANSKKTTETPKESKFKKLAQDATVLCPLMSGREKMTTRDVTKEDELTIIAFGFAPKFDDDGQPIVNTRTA